MLEALLSFDKIAEYLGIGGYGLSVLKIIGVDIVLAGDNAVVIALACRTLPPRQRTAGIVLGTAAAVVMRIVFTLAVGSLLGVPFLGLAGGLILFWIALKLLIAEEPGEESVRSGETLWDAIKTVAIADAVMSLDNVLAIAGAARGDWMLIVIGLLISIPLVVGGSTLIMSMLTRYPMLVWGGAALLGWIAAELIVGEELRPFLRTPPASWRRLSRYRAGQGGARRRVRRGRRRAAHAGACGCLRRRSRQRPRLTLSRRTRCGIRSGRKSTLARAVRTANIGAG
jgi:YjbE family integral membrane protein